MAVDYTEPLGEGEETGMVTDVTDDSDLLEHDPLEAPLPPYVITDADKERWTLSGEIAESLWNLYEDGEPDREYLWQMQRTIYHMADMPTGTPTVQETEEVEPDDDAGSEHQRAWEMWADIQKSKPGGGESDDAYWDHVAKICDLFDELFGNPDHIDLGPYEGAVADSDIAEAFESVPRIPYSAGMHPRDRMGKWAMKLNGVRAAAHDRNGDVTHGVARGVAARRVEVVPAGTPLPHPPLRARAGMARDAVKEKKTAAHVAALKALTWMYTEPGEKKLGARHEHLKSADHNIEAFHRAQHTADLAHTVASWATEHHQEIGMIAHQVSHTVLGAAEVTDEDWVEARYVLEAVSAGSAD